MQELRLVHLLGPRRGAVDCVKLDSGGTALIGRSESAIVAFDDDTPRTVSRRHALLWLASDSPLSWHLFDLASTAGTRVNGQPVQMRVLTHGDEIMLGADGPLLRVELPH